MKKKLALPMLATLVAASFHSNAEIRFNGFASIVAGSTLDEETSLFEYNDSFSFKPESKFALQTSADLSDGLSATAQIMARGSQDFEAQFEWAYLSYIVSDSLQVNAGKLRIPFYRYSDFLDVGYAYNWIRPPKSVYSLPFSTYEGVSVVYNHVMAGWDSSIQFTYGSFEGGINLVSASDESELQGITGVNWTVGNDWLTARAVYMTAETTISFANDSSGILLPGLELFGSLFPAHSDRLLVNEDDGSFSGIGISIDKYDVLVDMEMTQVEVKDSLVAKQQQYYVSVGYRINWDLTVFATLQNEEDTHDYSMAAALPETSDLAPGIPVRGSFELLLASQELKRDMTSVGVRYNFHPAAAFKVEYTTSEVEGRDGDSVLSASVDLVF